MSNLEKALRRAINARNKNSGEASGDDQSTTRVSSNSDTPSGTEVAVSYKGGDIALMKEITAKGKQDLEKRKIIYSDMLNTKVVDQFREIRTHIYQEIKKNNSPVLVTSVIGGTGNTFVTLNIAAAIALDDSKTSLIVDCNLAKPGFKDFVDETNNLGVTDYIENDYGLEELIQPVGINRLRLISSGTKKESITDYFTSKKLHQLFLELKQRYSDRIILVDSPAINDSADAKILSNFFSHVILVVPYRMVTENQIVAAIRAIGKEKIIGIVTNREPRFLSLFKNFIG